MSRIQVADRVESLSLWSCGKTSPGIRRLERIVRRKRYRSWILRVLSLLSGFSNCHEPSAKRAAKVGFSVVRSIDELKSELQLEPLKCGWA